MYERRQRDGRHVNDLLAVATSLAPKSDRPPPPPMSPPRAAAYIQQADRQRAEGQLVEALASLTLAAQGPRFAVHALRQRAQIEEQLGQSDEAIDTLKEVLHRATTDDRVTARVYAEIGDVYARRKEIAEAAYYYRRALKLDPSDAQLQTRLDWCEGRSRGPDDTTSRTDLTRL